MNVVKRPAVLTGLFILILLSLIFFRTHGWRVPAAATALFSHSRPQYCRLCQYLLRTSATTDPASDSREQQNPIRYLFGCPEFIISKRCTLGDRSAQ
jgi:hypothetical protein